MGKFYDHLGTDSWYYYVYGQIQRKPEGKSRNSIVSKSCGGEIYGDVAVIRSGPAEQGSVPEEFNYFMLLKALRYYETKSSYEVSATREKSRCARMMGIDLSDVLGIHVS